MLQPNASPWIHSYGYDGISRLTSIESPAGSFEYDYVTSISDRVQTLHLPGANQAISHQYDSVRRLTDTTLATGLANPANRHGYEYNAAHQRTKQTFTDNNYVDYTYDKIGQLQTAKGWENGGATPRLQEQFGYAYDNAWNLSRRTNNALVQTFNTDSLNQLTSANRTGTLTVAGIASVPGASLSSVTVSGTGLASGAADIYADGSWARTNATLADGNNSYTATAEDTYGRTAADTVSVNFPVTNSFTYDANGNLTTDGRRVFEYDFENQLTNVYVTAQWRSALRYDAFGRRRERKEYTWSGSAWMLTNEVRYVYDGMLVVQERNANNLPQVTYTRGNDLSGDLQGAGGIGGLLARTDNGLLTVGDPRSSAFYHCDGNGNVTALVNTNGQVVARYRYDPYGNLLSMSGPLAEANTYRFSSKEWHANAALYYYGYRFYEPCLQRWLNRDKIGEKGGLNLYQFVFHNPISGIDLWGLLILIFNGTSVICKENDGSFLAEFPATSGLDGSLNPESRNRGPIPPGRYTLNPSDISEAGFFRRFTGDWGRFRAPLMPAPGTETFGRTGFFLHGGSRPGSRGCIDVGSLDSALFARLQIETSPVDVIVVYPPPPLVPTFPPLCSVCDINKPRR